MEGYGPNVDRRLTGINTLLKSLVSINNPNR